MRAASHLLALRQRANRTTRRFALLLLGLCLLSVTFTSTAEADDWPQFLGPNRNGLSSETGLMEIWPAEGPTVVWRAKGGVGMSGLAIAQGRLVTMIQRDGQQWVVALDAKTGTPVWNTPAAPEYKNAMGDGPRATPTIAGDRVFAVTGEGILMALALRDGKIQWSRNVSKEHGGKPADYGMAGSALVIGDHVIVMAGAPRATVVAYHASTGQPAWTAGSGDAAGYSSPTVLNIHGQPQIVTYTGGSVLGIEPATGKPLWRHPYPTDYDCNIAVPLSVGGDIFISSGENHGCALLAVKPQNSSGRFDVSEVWASQGAKSVMRNEWQTSILLDGHLYGFDNVGSAGPVTHLTCVNAKTGERVWQKQRFGKGNLIAADRKLFISTMAGELVVVKATPAGFEELGRQELLGSTRQSPSLADGRLYLRDNQEIVCVGVGR